MCGVLLENGLIACNFGGNMNIKSAPLFIALAVVLSLAAVIGGCSDPAAKKAKFLAKGKTLYCPNRQFMIT